MIVFSKTYCNLLLKKFPDPFFRKDIRLQSLKFACTVLYEYICLANDHADTPQVTRHFLIFKILLFDKKTYPSIFLLDCSFKVTTRSPIFTVDIRLAETTRTHEFREFLREKKISRTKIYLRHKQSFFIPEKMGRKSRGAVRLRSKRVLNSYFSCV